MVKVSVGVMATLAFPTAVAFVAHRALRVLGQFTTARSAVKRTILVGTTAIFMPTTRPIFTPSHMLFLQFELDLDILCTLGSQDVGDGAFVPANANWAINKEVALNLKPNFGLLVDGMVRVCFELQPKRSS